MPNVLTQLYPRTSIFTPYGGEGEASSMGVASRSADFQICCIAGFQTRWRLESFTRPDSSTPCRFGNRRYSRLGSLRYVRQQHIFLPAARVSTWNSERLCPIATTIPSNPTRANPGASAWDKPAHAAEDTIFPRPVRHDGFLGGFVRHGFAGRGPCRI